MVGWSEWVDCGLTVDQEAALKNDGNYTGTDAVDTVSPVDQSATTAAAAVNPRNYYPVKLGCLGGAVRRLQTWLADLEYTSVRNDGQFGPITEAAVRDFQTKNGLEVDGHVGRLTWAALAAARKTAIGEANE